MTTRLSSKTPTTTNHYYGTRTNNAHAPSAPAENMGVPMDIDAQRCPSGATSSFQGLLRLTPESREQLRRTGSCFRCRQLGHMSKDCPVRFNPSVPRAPNRTIRSTDFIPASVPVAAPSVLMAQPVGSRDAMKELSDAFNRVKSL